MEVRRINSDTAFIDYMKGIERRVAQQETRPAGDIVIQQTLTTTDPNTGVSAVFGQLADGTLGFRQFLGDTTPPPVPSTPTVTSALGTVTVIWNGSYAPSGTTPPDYSHVNAYGQAVTGTSPNLLGTLINPNDSLVYSNVVSGDKWTFWLTSVDQNGNESAASTPTGQITIASVLNDAGLSAQLANTQSQINAANTAIATKNSVVSAGTAPTGTHIVGDVWFDTSNGNKIMRWDGSSWVTAQDQLIITAQNTAVSANNAAASANSAAAAANSAASAAQTSANGKNRIYYQPTVPTGGVYVSGDTWFDTANGNRTSIWNGSAWIVSQDTAISAATLLASSKGTVWTQGTAPALGYSYAWTGLANESTSTQSFNGIVSRTNYVRNPNFETDNGFWVTESGATLTRDTSSPIDGTASGKLSTGGDVYTTATAVPGQSWTFSVDYKTSGTVAGTPSIYLSDNVAASISVPLPLTQTIPGRFSVTLPLTSAGVTIIIASVIAPTSGGTIWFDNALLEKSATAKPYFDGSSVSDRQNDIWVNTANGNQIYTCSTGAAWTAYQFGTNAIADLSITNAKVSNLDAGSITTGYLSAARLAAQSITATALAAGSITATALAAQSITATALAAQSITATALAAQSITATALAAQSITASAIAAQTITSAQIATNTIVANNIAASTITATQIAASTITSLQIAASTIQAYNIAAGSIIGAHISAGAIDGKSITGADIKTSNSSGIVYAHMGLNSVKADTNPGYTGIGFNMNGAGVFAYDAGLYSVHGNDVTLAQGGSAQAMSYVQLDGSNGLSAYSFAPMNLTSHGAVSIGSQNSNVVIQNIPMAPSHAEFTSTNFSISGGSVSWDIGPLTADTTTAGASSYNTFVTAGGTSGTIVVSAAGYYTISTLTPPPASMGNGWVKIQNTTTNQELAIGNTAGYSWELFATTGVPVWIPANSTIRFICEVTTGQTCSSRVRIHKHNW